MQIIFNPKKFFLYIKNKDISTKFVWWYYIVSTIIIGITTINFAKIIGRTMLESNIKVGQAFYFSVPILVTVLVFIFIAFGIFISGGIIHVISILLGSSKPFNKSFTAYIYINIIPSTQLIFAGISYLTIGKFVGYPDFIRFFIYGWVFIMVYLTFYYTLECPKTKSVFGALVFWVLYLAQEIFRYLPSFLS